MGIRIRLLIVLAWVLACAASWAQLHITSFNSNGELTWTNPFTRGLYNVESGNAPAGPWNAVGSVVDKDGSKTNRITFPVSLTDNSAFYRVAWMPPDAIGTWDYRGYDNQGTLVITGRLSLTSTTLLSSDPPVVYGVQGTWNLQYAGPPTNALWWLGYQIGTGYLGGTVELHTSSLSLRWPTNVHDDNMFLSRDIWSNAYTGMWAYITFGPVGAGPFTATRISSTNWANPGPDARQAGKVSDKYE